MITETRKAIIELIEPFMEKDWAKWCLWQFEDQDFMEMNWMEDSQFISDTLNWTDTKIIWYYDITAVLKYINSEYYNYWNSASYLTNYIKISCIRNNIIEYIPNKPLHLYSEQEEKDLLNLLTTLKTNE